MWSTNGKLLSFAFIGAFVVLCIQFDGVDNKKPMTKQSNGGGMKKSSSSKRDYIYDYDSPEEEDEILSELHNKHNRKEDYDEVPNFDLVGSGGQAKDKFKNIDRAPSRPEANGSEKFAKSTANGKNHEMFKDTARPFKDYDYMEDDSNESDFSKKRHDSRPNIKKPEEHMPNFYLKHPSHILKPTLTNVLTDNRGPLKKGEILLVSDGPLSPSMQRCLNQGNILYCINSTLSHAYDNFHQADCCTSIFEHCEGPQICELSVLCSKVPKCKDNLDRSLKSIPSRQDISRVSYRKNKKGGRAVVKQPLNIIGKKPKY